MRNGTREKLNGDEWDAFSRRARRILSWKRGELKGIKRRFWRKFRRRARCEMDQREG